MKSWANCDGGRSRNIGWATGGSFGDKRRRGYWPDRASGPISAARPGCVSSTASAAARSLYFVSNPAVQRSHDRDIPGIACGFRTAAKTRTRPSGSPQTPGTLVAGQRADRAGGHVPAVRRADAGLNSLGASGSVFVLFARDAPQVDAAVALSRDGPPHSLSLASRRPRIVDRRALYGVPGDPPAPVTSAPRCGKKVADHEYRLPVTDMAPATTRP